MENYAKRLALEHNVQGKVQKKFHPLRSMLVDFEKMRKAYDILTESVALHVPIPPSGEWILDNFYVIEEQVNGIPKEWNEEQYRKLPAVKGKARIFALAEEMVSFTEGNISKETIERFITAYETKRKIEMEEIWMLPLMLKIALIQKMRQVCERIITSQYQKLKVASLVERIIKNKTANEQVFHSYRNIQLNGEISSYVEFLVFLLKKEGKAAKQYIAILKEEVKKAGTTVDEIIQTEHYDMALQRVTMSNSMTSFKNLLRYHWSDIFEKINGIEEILLQDEWYRKSDYDTKTLYRNAIQRLAKKAKLSETYVASEVMRIAQEEEKHIGVYLLGEEKEIFANELGIPKGHTMTLSQKLVLYLGSVYIPALIVSLLTMKQYFWLGWILLSEIFVGVVNHLLTKFIPPRILPRLEEIPSDVNTFVIVPTLLKSAEKVQEMMRQIEIFALSNPLEHLYFALLGDCSEETQEQMELDDSIRETGVREAKRLNEKYGKNRFFFLYRKRVWNASQEKWLGYERKRGMITEFVHFLLTQEPGTFCVNTITQIPTIKYIITLDADTLLPIDSAKKLIGTMEHPLNRPEVHGKIVTKGYGLIQPKVGITMESATASWFAKVFAGEGGIDVYSTAESNVYQDVFGEGIFTGKGIFHVGLFHELLAKEIPENTVLSHDLLEGSYLRCGLASDIEVIDGFPSKVNAYLLRAYRWTRGDWQILRWLTNRGLNVLSRYKMWDNLRRSLVPIFLFFLCFTSYRWLSVCVLFFPFFLESVSQFFHHRVGRKAKNYLPMIHGWKGSLFRCTYESMLLPYQAWLMLKAITVTLYRLLISKKHLLEWITASEAEKNLGNQLSHYWREMKWGPMAAVILLLENGYFFFAMDVTIDGLFYLNGIIVGLLALLWIFLPLVSYEISQPIQRKEEKLSEEEEKKLQEIAQKTWSYFADTMIPENHYLPPDNYQLGRKKLLVTTTSATNIGLGLMAIIAAYDMQFLTKEEALTRLQQSLQVIAQLEKWHGHLYNWYDISSLQPLSPSFVSTVDSGNYVGYLYVVQQFLREQGEEEMATQVWQWIQETDFSVLYDSEKNLFSIGYDVHENQLVDSYYDLLASEARLASFVAIAKRDVPYKHWFSMSRTLTTVDRYQGLVSWSGTMFEYFMPLIVMPNFPYTLWDETYAFCIYSQKKYAKKLAIPWGISESAFYLQDLNYHYQYKAFGIPWLGLKRGLKEEVVVAPYSSFLALSMIPQEVLKNAETLQKLGAYDRYGFYDAIDFTPNRVSVEGHSVVKTYMAHHQALILLSINNYWNHHILQQRFQQNATIQSALLLLEERVPTNVIFTKKKKEKVKGLKYQNEESYVEHRIEEPCGNVNIQSNSSYTLLMNDRGEGYATWKGLLLTKYNDRMHQGNCLYIKDLASGKVISNTPLPFMSEEDTWEIRFSPSKSQFYRKSETLDIVTQIAISSEEDLELREITLQNKTEQVMHLELITYLEPVLADRHQDIVHPAYQHLFLRCMSYENGLILEKRSHGKTIYYMNFLVTEEKEKVEWELDKAKVIGRLNTLANAAVVKQEVPYSNECGLSTNTILSFKKEVTIPAGEKRTVALYYGVSEQYDTLVAMYQKYQTKDSAKRLCELAYAKSLVENHFLGYKGKEIITYLQLFALLQQNHTREKEWEKIKQNRRQQCHLWKFGISGDNPILFVRIGRVNDIYVVKELISAMEYYHQKNVVVDLVIYNEEGNQYEQYVQDKLYETISSKGLGYLLHQNGGIFIVKKNDTSPEEECLLLACSDMIINAKEGFLKEQLWESKEE